MAFRVNFRVIRETILPQQKVKKKCFSIDNATTLEILLRWSYCHREHSNDNKVYDADALRAVQMGYFVGICKAQLKFVLEHLYDFSWLILYYKVATKPEICENERTWHWLCWWTQDATLTLICHIIPLKTSHQNSKDLLHELIKDLIQSSIRYEQNA